MVRTHRVFVMDILDRMRRGLSRGNQILTGLITGSVFGLLASKMRTYTDSSSIVDLRPLAEDALKEREKATGKSFKRAYRRPVSDISGITMHQMGFSRGNDPTRYLGIPAHYIITPDGAIYQFHDWEEYLYTSSKLNSFTLGVELAGNFRGSDGKWRKPEKFGQDVPTPAQIQSMRNLVAYVQKDLAKQGIALDSLWGHRQGSPSRGIDPGPEVWSQVVPWANRTLGLVDRSNETRGDGQPIPESWKVQEVLS